MKKNIKTKSYYCDGSSFIPEADVCVLIGATNIEASSRKEADELNEIRMEKLLNKYNLSKKI